MLDHAAKALGVVIKDNRQRHVTIDGVDVLYPKAFRVKAYRKVGWRRANPNRWERLLLHHYYESTKFTDTLPDLNELRNGSLIIVLDIGR